MKIGKTPFYACTNLSDISVAQDNPNYCSLNGVLYNKDCSKILACPQTKCGEYTLPVSINEIGEYAFLGCSLLTSVAIPNSVTEIGEAAFSGCTSLSSVTIPNSLTEIKNQTFYACSSLASVIIPESVTLIKKEAFYFCTCLTYVTIPASIKAFGEDAFACCNNLTSVYYNCENPIENFNSNIFRASLYNATLYVPAVAVEKCKVTSPWKYFKNIQAYDFSGVEAVGGDTDKTVTGRYDMYGSPVDDNYRGPVIERYSDGSTKKTLQK